MRYTSSSSEIDPLRKADIPDKFSYSRKGANFLSHLLTTNTIKANSNKIRVINKFPNSVKPKKTNLS